MPRHWVTIILALILISGTVVLLDSPSVVLPMDDSAPDETAVAHLTGYLVGVTTTQYNEDGNVEYLFTADRLSHYQIDRDKATLADYTTITSPLFTIHQKDNAPWHIRARQGQSLDNDELFILREDVRAWQDDPVRGLTQITTDQMHFRPPQQIAETDQFVMITSPGSRTQGRGMHADLKQETLRILSEGSTVYEPTP